jgi:hypothetical protein
VRQPCKERDALWRNFGERTRAYAEFVRDLKRPISREELGQVECARLVLQDYRDAIRSHCQQHGCDPEYLERLET